MIITQEDNNILTNIIKHEMEETELVRIELVIRPECNQQCEYCYLYQHGHESYPKRYDNKTIINNMNLLMDHFIQKDYKIQRIDLFAGDLFFDDLFFEIIKPIKKYYEYLYNNHPEFFIPKAKKEIHNTFINPSVIIPCNMSFCSDDVKIDKVKKICKEFASMGVKIYFSYSTDGKYAVDIREKKEIDDSFFDKVFALCEEMEWGPHPMISYESIDYAIDNYEWFKSKMQQFTIQRGSIIPAYLEVRNNGWDEVSIQKYKKFLLYFLDDIFHNLNKSNLELFFKYYFRTYYKIPNGTYIFKDETTSLGKFAITNTVDNNLFCSMGSLNLCINMGDLSFLPCHRLAYPEVRGGRYTIQNNQITGIEAYESLNSYLNLHYYNVKTRPKCVSCIYQSICLKGCPGAEYEIYGNAFTPIPSVCKMLQAKYDTLLEYYHNIGLFHFIFTKEPEYPVNTIFQQLLLTKGYSEYTQYKHLGDLTNVRR